MSSTTINSKKVTGIVRDDDIKSFEKCINKKNMNEPLDDDDSTSSILSYAIMWQSDNIVEYLLNIGADINSQHDTVPILMTAIKEDSEDIAIRLLDMGADVNATAFSSAIEVRMLRLAARLAGTWGGSTKDESKIVTDTFISMLSPTLKQVVEKAIAK